MPIPSILPSLPPNLAWAHIDKEAENSQSIGAAGGSAEVPIEFLIEVNELHLGGEHRAWVPPAEEEERMGAALGLWGSQVKLRISAWGGSSVGRMW